MIARDIPLLRFSDVLKCMKGTNYQSDHFCPKRAMQKVTVKCDFVSKGKVNGQFKKIRLRNDKPRSHLHQFLKLFNLEIIFNQCLGVRLQFSLSFSSSFSSSSSLPIVHAYLHLLVLLPLFWFKLWVCSSSLSHLVCQLFFFFHREIYLSLCWQSISQWRDNIITLCQRVRGLILSVHYSTIHWTERVILFFENRESYTLSTTAYKVSEQRGRVQPCLHYSNIQNNNKCYFNYI